MVTPPTVEPLTLDDAKHHLRVTWEDENDRIEALIVAAREHLDGRDGILGRALTTQTWDYTLREFPAEDCIRLQLPPVQTVESIKYRDENGTLQTFSSSNYFLGADKHWRPVVHLAAGASWPGTRDQADAVVIQTKNGYGDAGENVPEPIKQMLLLLVGHWYVNREPINIGNITTALQHSLDALIAQYELASF